MTCNTEAGPLIWPPCYQQDASYPIDGRMLKKSYDTTKALDLPFGNSWITFHHFIIRELFLVSVSSWLT